MSVPTSTTDVASLPASRSGLRFTLYPGHAALRIISELQQLELAGAKVPFGTDPVADDAAHSSSTQQAWTTYAAEGGFRLVTASIDGMLAGFVAGTVHDGVVDIRQITLSAAARTLHPELVGELADVYIEAAELPWGSVEVWADSPVVAHLLGQGWRPAPDQQGSARLLLSGHLA